MPKKNRLSEKDTTHPNSSQKKHNSTSSKEAAAIAVILLLAEKWPSGIVPRKSVREFTGGLYSPGYMGNMDSLGIGPEGAFCIGRQKVYPKYPFVDWLIARIEA